VLGAQCDVLDGFDLRELSGCIYRVFVMELTVFIFATTWTAWLLVVQGVKSVVGV